MTDKKLPADVENRWNDAHPRLVGLAVEEFEKQFLADELAKARAEEKQLSYNEGVEDARLAVCSVEKNTWEKYVYLRIDKIFELLKKLSKKD